LISEEEVAGLGRGGARAFYFSRDLGNENDAEDKCRELMDASGKVAVIE
jgi:hypothetical protein